MPAPPRRRQGPAIAPGEDRNDLVLGQVGHGVQLQRPAIAPGEDRNRDVASAAACAAGETAPVQHAGRVATTGTRRPGATFGRQRPAIPPDEDRNAVFALGVWLGGVVGALVLCSLAAAVGVLLALTWPGLTATERSIRLLVLLAVVAIALQRLA